MPDSIVPPVQISSQPPFPGDEPLPFVPPIEPTGAAPFPGDEPTPFKAPEADLAEAAEIDVRGRTMPGRSSRPAVAPPSQAPTGEEPFRAPASDLEAAPFQAPESDSKFGSLVELIRNRTVEQ